MAHGDGFIEIWDLSLDGTPIYGISEHYLMINDIIFTETRMISASQDGRVMIFDLELGQLSIARTFGSPVSRLEISPDGTKLMVLHDNDLQATVLSVVSGGILFVLRAEDASIVDMGFTEDGKQAVIITDNGSQWVGEIFTDFSELLEASKARLLQ
jgi:WD40 repeat protein